MENNKIKLPIWFWLITIFFILWNIMGVISFFAHTFISQEALDQLPANEKALYAEYPLWTSVVFAIAVSGGLLGSIGLILRKKWAKIAFIISLFGIIPQMIHNVFFTKSTEVYGPGQAMTMPIMVIVFALFLIWFANFCIKKEWLK